MIDKSIYIEPNLIWKLFEGLNASNIRYAVIKNIDSELPYFLPDGKDIDLLVHEESRETFIKAMQGMGFKSIAPPLGEENGWTFAYKLREYTFWELNNIEYHFYIDATEKLMCKSLTPFTWIPLSKEVNDFAWEHIIRYNQDEDHSWMELSAEAVFPYLIARCVYDKRFFPKGYIQEIKKSKHLLDEIATQKRLETIFFRYTPRLINLIKNDCYSEICRDYLTFTDY